MESGEWIENAHTFPLDGRLKRKRSAVENAVKCPVVAQTAATRPPLDTAFNMSLHFNFVVPRIAINATDRKLVTVFYKMIKNGLWFNPLPLKRMGTIVKGLKSKSSRFEPYNLVLG